MQEKTMSWTLGYIMQLSFSQEIFSYHWKTHKSGAKIYPGEAGNNTVSSPLCELRPKSESCVGRSQLQRLDWAVLQSPNMRWTPRVSVIIPNCFMHSISYNLIASSPGMSKDSQCVSERIKVKEIKYWSKFLWLLNSRARILNQVLLQPNWKLFINKAPRQGVLGRWDTCVGL